MNVFVLELQATHATARAYLLCVEQMPPNLCMYTLHCRKSNINLVCVLCERHTRAATGHCLDSVKGRKTRGTVPLRKRALFKF